MKRITTLVLLILCLNVYAIPVQPHIADNGHGAGSIAWNWQIEDFELLYAINQYCLDVISDETILNVIDFWAANSYRFDETERKYKSGGTNE